MVLALRGVLIAYVVAWAVLLILCLRKREFCPILSDSRKTRWFWLATFVLVNPLLTILYFVFGQIRSPQARAVRVVRDLVLVLAIGGFFVNVPGLTHLWMQPFLGRSTRADRRAEAHLAAIEAANNTNTSSSTSSSDNSRLACRRIAVVIEGNHPLLHRIGSDLVEQLEEIPAVETVELHHEGAFPEAGQRSPDIFVRLHLGQIKETPVPYSLKLSTQISADVGRVPLHSTHSYHDGRTPPLLNFNLRIEMQHRSTTTGYESVRYSMAAGNIAKGLGEAIAKTLGQWQDKYGLLPELSDEFYGRYITSELPEPLEKLGPALLGSYTGLLKHNETFRQFTLTDEAVEVIKGLRDAMMALGWKGRSSDWDARNIDLRLRKDDRDIHIFQIRPREFVNGVVLSSPSEQKRASVFGVVDVQRFSDDELHQVLDGLLAEPVSMERLMLFDRMFDKQQRERLFEILENQSPRDVFAQIRLVEMYQQRHLSEKALNALSRARTLLWAVRDDSTYKNRLKGLAKKLGDENLVKTVPTVEDFRDAGFIEITPGSAPVDVTTDLDHPVTMFCLDSEGQPVTSTVTIRSSGNDNDPFCVEHVQRQTHGCAWGSHGGFGVRGSLWQARVNQDMQDASVVCLVEQIAGRERFKIAVTVSEH